jgi:putative ATP-binding cassette transporter
MNPLLRFGILEFLQRETSALDRKLLVMTLASGTANALILAVINAAVESMRQGGPNWRHLLLFVLSLALFAYSLRYILYESSRIAEDAIRNVRVRLADKIRRSDLLTLESIGEADIHARISRETSAIGQAARPLFSAAQSSIMVIFTLAYIAIVSPMAVLISVAMIVCGVAIYLKDRKSYEDGLQEASRCEDDLFTSLTGLLMGFKELRINRLKSDDVFEEFGTAATRVRDARVRVMLRFSNNVVFVESFFVLLVGAIVFVLPILSPSFSGAVTKVVAAVLFLMGPLANVAIMIPVLSQVNVTVDNLRRLEATLDETLVPAGREDAPLDGMEDFSAIRFEGVCFNYRSPDGSAGFQVGPIDEEVRRGEILFLVGGNGSGKTTLLKLFTALYRPMQGCIRVDGAEIVAANVQSYRNLFSAIFSDFHLFDKLHGLRDAAPERVDQLLRLMEISSKTAFRDGRFSTILLSTGQRKRLALVVSYLEDKPVYIFDEVAADQDPRFRGYFYDTLLPELKRAGKTVLVVSHDDRYFHVADRVLEMDYGKFREIARTGKPSKPRKRPSNAKRLTEGREK